MSKIVSKSSQWVSLWFDLHLLEAVCFAFIIVSGGLYRWKNTVCWEQRFFVWLDLRWCSWKGTGCMSFRWKRLWPHLLHTSYDKTLCKPDWLVSFCAQRILFQLPSAESSNIYFLFTIWNWFFKVDNKTVDRWTNEVQAKQVCEEQKKS